MIKLVITDMDGTFLNSKGDFDRDYYHQVRTLMESKSVHFATCTGKQCERIEELFGEDAKGIWILGDSATRIKHSGKFIYQSLIPNKIGLEVIMELKSIKENQTIIACTEQCAVIEKGRSDKERKIVRGSYAKVLEVDDLSAITEDFVKITVLDIEKECYETVEKIRQFEDRVYMVASEAAWIDITNHSVHKGTTVQKLQSILNVTADETMAFGDGYNDLELLGQATYSFAMRNAFDEVKLKASFGAPSNDENGVLFTVEKFLALNS